VFNTTLAGGILKLARQIFVKISPSMSSTTNTLARINQRQIHNITTSMFHYTNLSHLKQVPFYRISTPKAPFYSEKGGPDDRYIIPIENYKSMSIHNYAELMGYNA
jgi:hypothetical protein